MTTPAPRRPGGRRPPTFHRVTVSSVTDITPRMRRVELSGDDLASYPCDGPGSHLKLLLPSDGHRAVPVPERGQDGPVWPGGGRPLMRTYTARRADTTGRLLTVDFALHDDGGPATEWATAATPGDQVVVTGARGPYRIGESADWTLLAADETALPAVASILEEAPAGARVLLFAEVADAAERLSFSTTAELTATWVLRGGSDAAPGMLAADAVATADLPPGRGAVWVGLEASAMRSVRSHLLTERGVGKDALYTRAYWKQGAVNHPDHDTGEEDEGA